MNIKNKFGIFFLIFTILYGQTALFAYDNPLFKLPEKAFLNATIKEYTWDRETYLHNEIKTKRTTYLSSSETSNLILNKLQQGKDKVSIEYNYENNYDEESSLNYINLQEFNNNSGKNEYKQEVQSSSYSDETYGNITGETDISTSKDILSNALFFTIVSNLGHKGRTYGVKSWESETAKKLYVEGFRVNYIDMYRQEIKKYCFNGTPIPKLLLNPSSTLALSYHASGEQTLDGANINQLSKYPGIVDLYKTPVVIEKGDICTLTDTDLGTMLFQTGIFYKSGDLRLNFKDPNQNLALASAVTADAIYLNNGMEASIVYDKDWNTVHRTKKSKSRTKVKHWLEMTTSTSWLKIIPFGMVSSTNDFGSYSIADASRNGTKISGLLPQVPTTTNTTITPDGHSLNFVVIPLKKHGTGMGGEPAYNSGTWQESSTVKSWASWVMIVIIIVIIIIIVVITILTAGAGAAAAGPILAAAMGPTVASAAAAAVAANAAMVAFLTSLTGALLISAAVTLGIVAYSVRPENISSNISQIQFEKQRTIDINSMISNTAYKNYLEQFNGQITGSIIKSNNTDLFWDSALNNEDLINTLDGVGNYSNYNGTFIHQMMKDSTKFWKAYHIKNAFAAFNTSVNLSGRQTSGLKISGNGTNGPLVNYRYIVNKITASVDTTFKQNSNPSGAVKTKQDWKVTRNVTENDIEVEDIILNKEVNSITESEIINNDRGRDTHQ